ncbi:MAG TPA: hypothetical protein VKQ72_11675 [Aggregatilineales bacterium]|nr:hypothetical protein [Aggregatilineales bacterium]
MPEFGSSEDSNWKTMIYALGAVLGAALGLAAAHLYSRNAEEASHEGPLAPIGTGEAFKIGMALLALLRQVAALGSRHEEIER